MTLLELILSKILEFGKVSHAPARLPILNFISRSTNASALRLRRSYASSKIFFTFFVFCARRFLNSFKEKKILLSASCSLKKSRRRLFRFGRCGIFTPSQASLASGPPPNPLLPPRPSRKRRRAAGDIMKAFMTVNNSPCRFCPCL